MNSENVNIIVDALEDLSKAGLSNTISVSGDNASGKTTLAEELGKLDGFSVIKSGELYINNSNHFVKLTAPLRNHNYVVDDCDFALRESQQELTDKVAKSGAGLVFLHHTNYQLNTTVSIKFKLTRRGLSLFES